MVFVVDVDDVVVAVIVVDVAVVVVAVAVVVVSLDSISTRDPLSKQKKYFDSRSQFFFQAGPKKKFLAKHLNFVAKLSVGSQYNPMMLKT